MLDFKEYLCSAYSGRNVLISTHDVVVKILVADALGMNMDRINRIWVTNASISVIEYGEDLPYLVSLSEASTWAVSSRFASARRLYERVNG